MPRETARNRGGRWSAAVSEQSDALDLEARIFELDDPKHIAASLKRSAEASSRRKAEPFRSAVSMLTFYVNRAGKNLPDDRRAILEQARGELRHLYGRWPEEEECHLVGADPEASSGPG